MKDWNLSKIYHILPWRLLKVAAEIDKEGKLTLATIQRTIRALLSNAGLKEGSDFYSTYGSKGRRKYLLEVNKRTLRALRKALK